MDDLNAMGNVEAVRLWTGMKPEVLKAIKVAMGATVDELTGMREVALIQKFAWEADLATTEVEVTPQGTDADGNPILRVARALKAIERGQVGSLRRVCLLRFWFVLDDGSGGPTVPIPKSSGVPVLGQESLSTGGSTRSSTS